MIPLRDNIPSRTTPVVNYALIVICVFVFLAQAGETPGGPSLVERYGMVPARITDPDRVIEVEAAEAVPTLFGTRLRRVRRQLAPPGVPAWLTLLTCIFLHGGWLHLIGNLWFLWIFGDNVEDRLGHLGYLLFYLGAGVTASVCHLAAGPGSPIPTIGASGAIAGVMGAYFLLYPKAMVLTLVPIFFIYDILVLPAPLFLGVWFVLQLFQGTFAITQMESQGVAWWAHIGGFVAGLVVALSLRRKLNPPVLALRPGTERTRLYRAFPRRRSYDNE
ncbi:MAG: rhomboid family intramembrane serine protease [Planctomycetota bacterium]